MLVKLMMKDPKGFIPKSTTFLASKQE